jgi:hypothetical protein
LDRRRIVQHLANPVDVILEERIGSATTRCMMKNGKPSLQPYSVTRKRVPPLLGSSS